MTSTKYFNTSLTSLK